MPTRSEIIDDHYRGIELYDHVPYRPIGETVIKEVERMGPGGLYLSTACALIEQESTGRPIMGCDFGTRYTNAPPYCHVEATRERVKALIENYYTPPVGGANGVSYTQLTTIGYVEEAERLGGAHLAWANMRVGFRILNGFIADLGWPAGAAAYNAGPGNWRSVLHTYGADMARKEREWAERLKGASDVPKKIEPLVPPGFKPVAPRAGNYEMRHPTRYEYRDDVAALIRRIYERFDGIHINTYHKHPEVEPRDTTSFDVWGAGGRNDPIDRAKGREIVRYIFDDPNPPWIDWIIFEARIWGRVRGTWIPFGTDPFSWHYDHIHVTFTGDFKILP